MSKSSAANLKFRIENLANYPQFIPVVAKWLYDEWGYRREGASLETSIERVSQRCNLHGVPVIWIAISATGVPIATISIVEKEDPTDEPGPWVSSLYTVYVARGRGCGGALLSHLEEYAAAKGCARLLLTAATPDFYAKRGWQETGRIKGGEPIMQKRIS
ncbi:GNAT family N-acetyltransferase [Stappia sp. GBMRC 2046]|uniref:GNAT family N-acetyltransferase n=1 Tax=Stappia sediminis TaxID=2692190 RepID=A0A7X3S8C9_9HYPH|nr:GNAT family N-acetyltransferase [Stappia sediminis]MXN65654.1 GNAT family N-acetyltransferase [Stappia sediminis]